MCLSAIGSGINNPTLNRAKNQCTPVTEISNYLGTCPLQNYGEIGGERCADQCCFEDIPAANNVHALVLHECDSGKIIDFQCPPKGLSCPDDVVCVDMTCWQTSHCTKPEPEVDLACMDPCKLWHTLRQARLQMLAEKCTVSWRNGSKAGSYRPQDYNELLCEETNARQMCLECEPESCVLTDLPGCF